MQLILTALFKNLFISAPLIPGVLPGIVDIGQHRSTVARSNRIVERYATGYEYTGGVLAVKAQYYHVLISRAGRHYNSIGGIVCAANGINNISAAVNRKSWRGRSIVDITDTIQVAGTACCCGPAVAAVAVSKAVGIDFIIGGIANTDLRSETAIVAGEIGI